MLKQSQFKIWTQKTILCVVCMHVHICVWCMHMVAEPTPKHMCPEQKIGSGDLCYLSTPYSGSFTEPGVHAALDRQAASPSHPPVSTLLRAGVAGSMESFSASTWVLGSKLQTSYVHSKHS